MKSWISFLLPSDEYKEKKILYFMAEGSIISFLFLISIFMINRHGFNFQIDLELALFSSIFIFLIYVLGRYAMAGMEYTDIATEHSYKKELKNIFRRTISFVVIFLLSYLFIVGVPGSRNGWIDIIGLLLSVSLILFFSSYISLKRSYKKNKELL